ncbi:MAG: DUF4442 domain-containing protein [Spirochaetia bacterium]|nr:DUF4442 domain-containing protein [Spirochaetia bacterium]
MKKKNKLLKLLNYYPPYLGAGVKVVYISPDFLTFRVQMKLRWFNKNYMGTHFGGSLYSMCDPFFMIILIENLGDEYIVWDKAAKIDFIKPGKGKVIAQFSIDPNTIDIIKKEVSEKKKILKIFHAEIMNEENQVIARLEKTLYIRKAGRLKNKKLL